MLEGGLSMARLVGQLTPKDTAQVGVPSWVNLLNPSLLHTEAGRKIPIQQARSHWV